MRGCDGAAGNVAVKGKDLELSVTLTLKVYTVTFNADNGTLPYTKTVKHGKKLRGRRQLRQRRIASFWGGSIT